MLPRGIGAGAITPLVVLAQHLQLYQLQMLHYTCPATHASVTILFITMVTQKGLV